jgi:hypothetical protein
VASGAEFRSQFSRVVNLSICDSRHNPAFALEGLVAVSDIHDAEAVYPDEDTFVSNPTAAIGTAMKEAA